MTSSTTTVSGAAQQASAPQGTSHYRFKPWNVGRFVVWSLFAAMLIVAPHVFRSGLALTMLSQIGYLIIICLSYNILLGQGGMLSFGHAVYTGLGSFIAIHAMNMATKGAAHPAGADSTGRRAGRHVLRHPAGLRDHQEVGHHVCHDHAGHW